MHSTGEKRYEELSDAERSFVDAVARHYHEAHGVTWEKGRVMAWMIISDPVEQTLHQICAAVEATPDQIEQLIEQLVLAGLYQRIETQERRRATGSSTTDTRRRCPTPSRAGRSTGASSSTAWKRWRMPVRNAAGA